MSFSVVKGNWTTHRIELSRIRRLVFIDEQQVPEADEWDPYDETSQHWLAYNDRGESIATARLKPDGQVSRMAVLKPYRGLGVGSLLLRAVIEVAHQQSKSVYLYSQTHAVGFYEQFGFHTVGEKFLDAGIPHIEMRL